jgi:lipopolysaccharide transport system permease protein
MWIKHRELIWSFTKRELIGRYRGSFLGLLWSFVNPLFLLMVYTVVFSKMLQVRFDDSSSPLLYGVYLLCGMIPWLAFSETLGKSATLVTGQVNLVKKTVFPLEILSVVSVLTGFIHSLFGMGILIAALAFAQKGIPSTILFLPVVMMAQLLLTVGLSWFLASIGVFIRDTAEVMRLLLTPWMLLTPILYPMEMIPERFRDLMYLNPMTVIVSGYRQTLLEGQVPDWAPLLGVILFGAAFAALGYFWFMRTKRAFADVV